MQILPRCLAIRIGQHRPHAEPDALGVDVHDAIPDILGHVGDRIAGHRDPGIVHQHVHRTVSSNHRCERVRPRVRVPYIQRDSDRLAARPGDLGGGLLRGRNVEADDLGAGRPETQCSRLSDAAAGPRDDRHLP